MDVSLWLARGRPLLWGAVLPWWCGVLGTVPGAAGPPARLLSRQLRAHRLGTRTAARQGPWAGSPGSRRFLRFIEQKLTDS